jgi:hypothetical protein
MQDASLFSTTTFGLANNTVNQLSGDSRVIQLALKLVF